MSFARALLAVLALAGLGAAPAARACEILVIGALPERTRDLVEGLGYQVDYAYRVPDDLHLSTYRLVILSDSNFEGCSDNRSRGSIPSGGMNAEWSQVVTRYLERTEPSSVLFAMQAMPPAIFQCVSAALPSFGDFRVRSRPGNLAGLPDGELLWTGAPHHASYDLLPGTVGDAAFGRTTEYWTAAHCEPHPDHRVAHALYLPGDLVTWAFDPSTDEPALSQLLVSIVEWLTFGEGPRPGPCPRDAADARLDALEERLTNIENLLTQLVTQVDEGNCEVIRLVTTPEGQRSSDFCGGHDHRGRRPTPPRR